MQLIVDAKSGITGAGRKPATGSLYAEVAGDIRAYGIERHRHQPEIERLLRIERHDARSSLRRTSCRSRAACWPIRMPYSIARWMKRRCRRAYASAYAGSPFVRVVEGDRVPSVAAVTGTNDAELRVDVLGNAVRVICAIDNLGKGAAGQAVQNLNIMLGYPEETGLHARAIVAG